MSNPEQILPRCPKCRATLRLTRHGGGWVSFEATPIPKAVLGEVPIPHTVPTDHDYLLVDHAAVCGGNPCPSHVALMIPWEANRERVEGRQEETAFGMTTPITREWLQAVLRSRLVTCASVLLTRSEAVAALRYLEEEGPIQLVVGDHCRAVTKRGKPCRQKPTLDGDGYCTWHAPAKIQLVG
jgi:hypothetical protein